MVLLDFDERLLVAAQALAQQLRFGDIFDVRLYNVFDRLPADLVNQFDWFYTNPPYGSHNLGASIQLFVTRGCELAGHRGSRGCIILPNSADRPWTSANMWATQRFLTSSGWIVSETMANQHTYHLDDDPDLPSSTLLVESVMDNRSDTWSITYAGRPVACSEIPFFYNRTLLPPYPRYFRQSGQPDNDWGPERDIRA
jgi:predicted methyltransferase